MTAPQEVPSADGGESIAQKRERDARVILYEWLQNSLDILAFHAAEVEGKPVRRGAMYNAILEGASYQARMIPALIHTAEGAGAEGWHVALLALRVGLKSGTVIGMHGTSMAFSQGIRDLWPAAQLGRKWIEAGKKNRKAPVAELCAMVSKMHVSSPTLKWTQVCKAVAYRWNVERLEDDKRISSKSVQRATQSLKW